MRNIYLARMVCAAGLAAVVAAPARAQEEWQFQIAPYLWLAGLNGDVGAFPGVPPADVDASFSDILENLDFAFMIAGEARKGRGGILADVLYIDVASSGTTPGPLYSTANLDSEVLLGTIAGFWRPWSDEGASLDLAAGVRAWSVDTKLQLGAGVLPATTVSHDENWVDPLVGIRLKGVLGGEPFFQSLGLIVGGFGVGSDLMWDADVNLGYRWTDGFSTTIGYRYLSVDYADGGFVYDVVQQGPTVALIWNF